MKHTITQTIELKLPELRKIIIKQLGLSENSTIDAKLATRYDQRESNSWQEFDGIIVKTVKELEI